ncbi:hypothetical protein ACTU44_12610 [Thalassospira sp. SM2505]
MSYPHHPYGYEPTHCPVIGLVPRRRIIRDVECKTTSQDDAACQPDAPTESKERRPGFPFGGFPDGVFSPADIESMIEYVVATRQGWRASLVMRAFLRWWRNEVAPESSATDRKQSDAVLMLLALNQGRDGFVQGYLHDLSAEMKDHPKLPTPENPIEKAFNKSLRIAALALALSPIVLIFAVLMFVQIDTIISTGNGKLFGFSYDLLFFVGSFGAIGALTSMMMRLGKDTPWADMEPSSVFFNFLFRPCMGFCFALVVLLALRAGILPIPLDELHNLDDLDQISNSAVAGQQMSIVLVFAFLSGFSERLSTALVKRVENRVTSGG